MAEKKKTKVVLKGATPAGTLTWAWLEKPDTSEYGKNKYKVTILLKKGEGKNDEFAKKLNDLHKAAKGKADTRPAKDGDAMAEENEKREAMRGFWVLSFKSNNKPEQVDASKKPLKLSAKSGDFGKVAFAAAEFDTGANKGVTLYLNAVQLLERRAPSATDAFGDESDEYGEDTAEAPTQDRSGDDDDDDSDGNF